MCLEKGAGSSQGVSGTSQWGVQCECTAGDLLCGSFPFCPAPGDRRLPPSGYLNTRPLLLQNDAGVKSPPFFRRARTLPHACMPTTRDSPDPPVTIAIPKYEIAFAFWKINFRRAIGSAPALCINRLSSAVQNGTQRATSIPECACLAVPLGQGDPGIVLSTAHRSRSSKLVWALGRGYGEP